MNNTISFNEFVQQIDLRLVPYQNDLMRIMKVNPSSISFLLSGKRLRSALIYSSSSLVSMQSRVDLGMLIELIHAASLIHDDIIDESILRRGYSTLQQTYNETKAISAGHFLFSHIFTAILELPQLWQERFFNTLKDMCLGELWEIEDMSKKNTYIKRYMDTIKKKTAQLFVLCCGLKEPNTWDQRESSFGLYYGTAFQLFDDTLDVISTAKDLGKPCKQDDQMGVVTLPLFLRSLSPEKLNQCISKSLLIADKYLSKAKTSTQNPDWIKEADKLSNKIESLIF